VPAEQGLASTMIRHIAPSTDASSIRAEDLFLETELGLPAEVLRPLLEGARARGMAEAFEMMGRAAVFFDGAGTILHVGQSARGQFGTALSLLGRQLVAATPEGNRVLQAALGAALDGREMEADLPGDESGQTIRIEAIPGPAPSHPSQLLRAILFFRLDKNAAKALPAAAMAD
jgi:hypothetical protein